MTYRQALAWDEWLDWNWDRPDRTDHYVMKLITAVERGPVKNPMPIPKQRIEFEREGGRPNPETVAKRTARSKSFWSVIFARGKAGQAGK